MRAPLNLNAAKSAFMQMASQEDNPEYAANPLLYQAVSGKPVGLHQVTPVMQMMTNAFSPGSQAPTVSQSLKDVASGAGQYGQELLKNMAGNPMVDLANKAVPQLNMVRNFQSSANPLENYNIAQHLGVQNTPMNSNIQNATSDVLNYGPLAMGGATLAGKLGSSAIEGLGSIFGGPSASKLTRSALKEMPGLSNSLEMDASKEYAKAHHLIDGENNKVATNQYLVGKANNIVPSDEILKSFLPKELTSKNFSNLSLKDPQLRNVALDNWKNSLKENPTENHFFNPLVRKEMNSDVKGLYDKFRENPTGRNLQELRSQLATEFNQTKGLDAASRSYRSAHGQMLQKANEMLQNHLSQDPVALQGWKNGNDIMSKYVYPIRNTKLFKQMASGTKRYLQPQEFVNAAEKARESGKITDDHPIMQKADAIRAALVPGLIKRGIKGAFKLGIGGLIPYEIGKHTNF